MEEIIGSAFEIVLKEIFSLVMSIAENKKTVISSFTATESRN